MRTTALITVAALATAAQAQLPYPEARQDSTTDTYFGTTVADPYRWLEDDMSAETAQWVEKENQLTQSYLQKIPFRGKMLERLRQVSDYEKIGIPFEQHGRWYIYRNNGLQNQSVLYTMDSPKGQQRVFLDPNTLSDDGTVALKGISFSNDGRYMAYVISRSGSDWQEIYVKDVESGQLLTDHIEWAKFTGATWQGNGFYYSAYDAPEAGREISEKNEVQKIYYHRIGTPQSEDELFYMNPAQPLRFYTVSVNEEETVMFLYESGMDAGNNLYVRDLTKPNAQFIQMTADPSCQYSPLETVGDTIFIYTNAGAPRFRLMTASLRNPGYGSWQELVSEQPEVLDDVTFVDGRMVLTYFKDNVDRAYVHALSGERLHELQLPGVGTVGISGELRKKHCFYSYTTYTVPSTIYEYDIRQDRSTVYAEPKVNFNLKNYTTEMQWYTSKDGTRIPLFLTYKKGLKKNGRNPVYQYGYGGFNVSYKPSFSASRIPFLDAGGIYVYVVLRGGNEYGEQWHLAGTKLQKQNVFDDFIAASEWLIQNKYTDSKHLAIVGGSNGGLLVGACMTQRPDLYRVCIPEVGVMDMLRYHRFTIGWNWAPDYGTSEDSEEMFRYLYRYSPYHNLRPGVKYPSTLVTTADHDDRVVPAHSFKFAARLQHCQAGTAPTLIRIGTKAGHGGGKPLAKVLEEQADIYSFILYEMGARF